MEAAQKSSRKKKLSDAWLSSQLGKQRARRVEVGDASTESLRVRLGLTGSISFVTFVSVKGKHKGITLGRFPDLSLAGARQETQRVHSLHRSGNPQAGRPEKTFAEVLPAFLAYLAEHRRTPREGARRNSTATAKAYLEKVAAGPLGLRKLGAITAPEVAAVVEERVAAGTPAAANLVHRLLQQMFAWLETKGTIERSPSTVLKAAALGAGQSPPRRRRLSDDELRQVWIALSDEKTPVRHVTRCALRLLFLTAVRSGELREAKLADVDLDAATWRIPAENRKLKKSAEETAGDLIVPLSPQAVAIFRELREAAGNNPWVLAVRRNGEDDHLSDSALATAVKNLINPRVERAPILNMPPWTPHDARRTARSFFTERLDADFHIAERCLGHAVGSRASRAYDPPGGYLPQRRELLNKWGAFIEQLVSAGAP
jgi:integrase